LDRYLFPGQKAHFPLTFFELPDLADGILSFIKPKPVHFIKQGPHVTQLMIDGRGLDLSNPSSAVIRKLCSGEVTQKRIPQTLSNGQQPRIAIGTILEGFAMHLMPQVHKLTEAHGLRINHQAATPFRRWSVRRRSTKSWRQWNSSSV